MKRHALPIPGGPIRRGIALALALLLIVGLAPSGWSAPAIAQPQREAIQAIAEYAISGSGDTTDILLSRHVGFNDQTAVLPPGWPLFSPLRKLEYAYLSAVAVSPMNGEAFLALLSQRLARQYPAAAHEPALKALNTRYGTAAILRGTGYLGSKIRFAPIEAPAAPLPQSSEHTRTVLKVLAHYCQGSGILTAASLLEEAGLAPDVIYDLAWQYHSAEELLTAGISSLEPHKQSAALKRMVHRTATVYKTAKHDPALQAFFKRHKGAETAQHGQPVRTSPSIRSPLLAGNSTYYAEQMKRVREMEERRRKEQLERARQERLKRLLDDHQRRRGQADGPIIRPPHPPVRRK